ncbi:MAG: hypothetical protein JSV89_15700 [Spirochaetaceae bacterium]|nr:MAG: hypothetical protein JSV89_15700 [Spirochaetaceae bacterium]
MKSDRGIDRRLFKFCSNRTFHLDKPLRAMLVPFVIVGALLLAGCGKLSLNQLLGAQEPGVLSINPKKALIPASGFLDISGSGGFKPYTYENKTLKGTLDTATGKYVAPTSGELSGVTENIEIEVTDSLGSTVSAILTVFKPLILSPTSTTVKTGDSVNFSARGGVPSPNYDFYVNNVLEGSSPADWTYTFSLDGTFSVEAVDSLANRSVATITVLAFGGDLAIAVEQNYVPQGGSITVEAINPVGTHTFSIEPPGVGSFNDPNAITTTYNAPRIETVVTIVVEDSSSQTAAATVHVLSYVPDPLSLSPSSSIVDLGNSRTLMASGGFTPYTFWLEGDGMLTPHNLDSDKVFYHAPYYETTAWVWVEDAIGNKAKSMVNVNQG